MRLFVIGGSGFVGSSLTASAARAGYETGYAYARKPLRFPIPAYKVDLRHSDGALESALVTTKPDVVVYCAVAMSDGEPLCRAVNTDGVARTLNLIPPETRFIYLSSNAVFSGLGGPYAEDALPDAERCDTPYTVYGVTKAAGERLALSRPNSLVIRTATVDGYRVDGHLSARLGGLVSSLKKGEAVQRFGDRFISPTFLDTLVGGVLETLRPEFKYRGVLHVSGSERLSDYAYALKLVRRLNSKSALSRGYLEDVFGPGDCLRDTSLDVRFGQKLLETKLLTVQEQLERLDL